MFIPHLVGVRRTIVEFAQTKANPTVDNWLFFIHSLQVLTQQKLLKYFRNYY